MIRSLAALALVVAAANATSLRVPKERQLAQLAALETERDVNAPGPSYTTLTGGTPSYGNVIQNNYQYFQFMVPIADKPSIVIDVLPFMGDPDVFITTDGSVPTISNHAYASLGFNAEHIEILPTDSHYCSSTPSSCTINIGIYGFSNATFLIWAAAQSSIIELSNGYAFENVVLTDVPNFYKLYVSTLADEIYFQTSVQPSSPALEWELKLYASTKNSQPTSSDYEWKSVGDNGYMYSYISINPPPCFQCYVYVGVYCPSDHSEVLYTMLGVNGSPFIGLLLGAKMMGHAEQGQSRLYYADVRPGMTQLNITVNAQNGDPDIYVVADGSTPGPTNYQWRSQSIGSDQVSISGSDPLFRELCSDAWGCDIHIAVTGFRTTTYSITVNETGTPQPTPAPGMALPLPSRSHKH